MSDYQGNIIIKNPATPTGPTATGRAPGMWKLSEVAYWIKQGVWPNPAIVPDPYFPYVSMLLSTTSLGNANNNLFVDSSGAFNPISRNGNATQGSFTPYATNWSNYFDGTGDEVLAPNTPANFGSNSFTAECWVWFTSNTAGYQMVMGNQGTGDGQGWVIYTETNNQLTFAYSTGGGWAGSISTGVTPSVGVWTHIAVVRNGTAITFYVNGVASGTPISTASAIMSPSGNFRIGRYPYFPGGARTINAYISNVRLVNGTAVYTSNFTPPTSPLTAITNTSLLTCQSNRFRDASSNNYTITIGGNPSVQDFGPFAPAYPGLTGYNQSDITNWSGYFDGSGDYLSLPSNAAFGFGTGDFTVECWVNPSVQGGHGSSNNDCIIDFRPGSNGAYGTLYIASSGASVSWFVNSANRITGSAIPNNTWTHLAVSRVSGNTRLFINGVQSGSTYSDSTNYATTSPWIAQFNDGVGAGWFQGYISNMRLVKGTGLYSSTFTPPTTNLTAISGTSLLTLQNAAFTDNSTNNFVITPNGNVTVSGNSPFNTVGYWSNYFDGTGDYLTLPDNAALEPGSSDLTWEMWINTSNSTQYATLYSRTTASFTSGMWSLMMNLASSTAGDVGLYVGDFNTGAPLLQTTGVNVRDNLWHHIAVVRNGSAWVLYVDGVSRATATWSGTIADISGGPSIARDQFYTRTYLGYISNLRIVKGTAVYTSAFTPPTTPLTAITNTSLLTCQNSRFIDNSTNAFTVTVVGNTAVQTFDPFYSSTIGSNGGSMYFDGAGDYLTLPYSGNMQYAGDFTIECWVYPTARLRLYPCIFSNYNSFTTNGSVGIFAGHNSSSATKYQVAFNGSFPFIQSTADIVYGAWAHIALVRVGSTITLYINGVANGTGTSSATVVGTANNWWVGVTGDAIGNAEFNGYISNLRATPSAIYTTSFTPPTAPLTPAANTTLLLNGMNAGIYDAATINDMETVSGAQVVTNVSKFGGSSAFFNGTGGFLDIPAASSKESAFGTGNFTVEMWLYFNSVSGSPTIITFNNFGSGDGFFLNVESSAIGVRADGSTPIRASTTVTTGVWYHVAVTRNNGTLRLFQDGVNVGSTTWTTNCTAGLLRIGQPKDTTGATYAYSGYMDDLRVTRGIARYTSNFTPPTQAFPTY